MSGGVPDKSGFKGRRVLITGGLGFIGSSLAIELVRLGADLTLVDAMVPDSGANLFNIDPVKDDVRVNFCDVRDENSMNYLVKDQEFVFHLAGQNSHVLSLTNPFPDIDINIKGTAVILEACRHQAPDAQLVYSGTRGQYGSGTALPVAEDAPTNPKGIYEVSRLAAEKMIQVYSDVHGVRASMLRLTNIYGPRSQMLHNRFGVVNWFVRQALDDTCITVFGDGSILRDFLFIDDCVEAMLRCALSPEAKGEVLNVGHDSPASFLELVKIIIEASGTGRWEFGPFSPDRAAQEPGDFYSDISKIGRIVEWRPCVGLEEGIRRTVEFYEQHRDRFWTLDAESDA